MGVFTCSNCGKTMMAVCSSCSAWYCDQCFNWCCDPEVFPPSGAKRPVVPVVPASVQQSERAGLTKRTILLLSCSLVLSLAWLLSACNLSNDLSVVGRPTVTADLINKVLETHNSPATGLGSVFYDAGVQSGIDPVYGLGFFQHESSFGLKGEATVTFSIGNMHCFSHYGCTDGFASFSSWSEGIRAWFELISGFEYVGAGLTTLPAIVHRYAPSSDGNSESAYVQAVTLSVQSWEAGQV